MCIVLSKFSSYSFLLFNFQVHALLFLLLILMMDTTQSWRCFIAALRMTQNPVQLLSCWWNGWKI